MQRPNREFQVQISSKPPKQTHPTYWNGEPCEARICRVIVGKAEKSTYWYADLEGTEREAVEVIYGDQTFYIDNEDQSGILKVTLGKGSPQKPHSSLAVERVVGYVR